MNKHTFNSEPETSVFINGNDGLTVFQREGHDEQYITFSTRERALAVANIIIMMANSHEFPSFVVEEETP